MHMNVHAAVGILISMLFSNYFSLFQIFFIIGSSIIMDFDFLLSRFAINHNHRRLITHTFFLYIIILILGILLLNITDLYIYAVLLGICGIIHVSLDSFDWGIMLFYPIKNDVINGILSVSKEFYDDKSKITHCSFVITYYNSKFIIFLELTFGILALLSILLINSNYIYIFLIYLGILGMQLIELYRCKKRKAKN